MSFYPNNPRNIKMIKNLKKEYEVKCCYWNNGKKNILREDKDEFIYFSNKKIQNKKEKLVEIFSYFRYIKKVIKKFNPDCVFAYHWEIFILVRLALLFNYKIKIVYDISDIPAYNGIVHKIIKNIEEFFISKKVFLLYASPYFKLKYLKFKKNKCYVINNKPELDFKKKYLEYVKNTEEEIIVSFLGVFRDVEVFINIFEAAKDLKIKLKMFGDGFVKEKILKISEKYKNVEIGREYIYEELPKLYSDAQVILSLYSNKDENTKLAIGNKFYEALALRKLGIFPKNTKMGEYILENKLGYVVDPNSISDIRECFKDIIKNTKNCQEIKKNLLKLEEEKLFYEYEVEQFLPELKRFILEKC